VEEYQSILLQFVSEGGEPELELEHAYEYGRRAIEQGISILEVVDCHYKALADILSGTTNSEQSASIVLRAAALLKEALGPFEMTQRGYNDSIEVLKDQNRKLTELMEERTKLLKDRENFMMVVTHDLKTPITAADRCLMLMMEGDFGPVSAEQIEVLATMKDSNMRMLNMVKNLLEVYRYDHSEPILCLSQIDLDETLRTVERSFSLPAKMRNIKFMVDTQTAPIKVVGDGNALQHVLANLVDNAFKFTPEGGSITLSVRRINGTTFIEVADTGKGIAPEDLEKIFDRFYQATQGRKQYTGTGLGLYLCREIVNAHGGRISCQSELGTGTTFIIQLPAVAEEK